MNNFHEEDGYKSKLHRPVSVTDALGLRDIRVRLSTKKLRHAHLPAIQLNKFTLSCVWPRIRLIRWNKNVTFQIVNFCLLTVKIHESVAINHSEISTDVFLELTRVLWVLRFKLVYTKRICVPKHHLWFIWCERRRLVTYSSLAPKTWNQLSYWKVKKRQGKIKTCVLLRNMSVTLVLPKIGTLERFINAIVKGKIWGQLNQKSYKTQQPIRRL